MAEAGRRADRLRSLPARAAGCATGQRGICGVREHVAGGRLLTVSYGYPTGFAVDPIEKKPLFHFLPGSRILRFGTLGCTLGCPWCQNWPQTQPEHGEARDRSACRPRR